MAAGFFGKCNSALRRKRRRRFRRTGGIGTAIAGIATSLLPGLLPNIGRAFTNLGKKIQG